MKGKTMIKYLRIAIFLTVLCFAVMGTGDTGAMAKMDDSVYSIELGAGKSVTILADDEDLNLVFKGFAKNLDLEVTDGGVSACRTILKHKSEDAVAEIALPIPSPRARCRMLPASICVRSSDKTVSFSDKNVNSGKGEDSRLREMVEELFGEIEEND